MPISPPDTRASLLVRLKNAADAAAWDEFVLVYSPAVYRSARRMGLQSADADECVQDVLTAVATSVTQWLQRSDRGGFRAWLFRIARNTAVDYMTRRRHRPWSQGGSDAAAKLDAIADTSDVSSNFAFEYRRAIFLQASEIVRQQVADSTWQAFHRSSVLQQSIRRVAEELGMSTGSVYIARSRVMKRLQQMVEQIEGSKEE